MRCIYCGCENGPRSHHQDAACRRALRTLLAEAMVLVLPSWAARNPAWRDLCGEIRAVVAAETVGDT